MAPYKVLMVKTLRAQPVSGGVGWYHKERWALSSRTYRREENPQLES